MKLFLNSNVLIDYWFKRENTKTGESFFLYIEEIFERAKEENLELYLSSFSIEHVRLETIKNNCSLDIFNSIKDETIKCYGLKIISAGKEHKERARGLMKKLGLYETEYFEDFVNIAMALDLGTEFFLSRDAKLAELAKDLIKVVAPKQFILECLALL